MKRDSMYRVVVNCGACTWASIGPFARRERAEEAAIAYLQDEEIRKRAVIVIEELKALARARGEGRG
jgi:hypothetical protein